MYLPMFTYLSADAVYEAKMQSMISLHSDLTSLLAPPSSLARSGLVSATGSKNDLNKKQGALFQQTSKLQTAGRIELTNSVCTYVLNGKTLGSFPITVSRSNVVAKNEVGGWISQRSAN